MLKVIEKEKALPIVNRYLDMLARTGYVKHPTALRLLAYLFLVERTEWVYDFMTDKDYHKMDIALVKMFTDGGCLMPYQVIAANRLRIGRTYTGVAHYTGVVTMRVTEKNEQRISEKSKLRTDE